MYGDDRGFDMLRNFVDFYRIVKIDFFGVKILTLTFVDHVLASMRTVLHLFSMFHCKL